MQPDAAAELFAREGCGSVPMRAVAAHAGVRESSIYKHFTGKQALLDTLYAQFIELVPLARPSQAELADMMALMQPREVFKAMLFHVGKSVGARRRGSGQPCPCGCRRACKRRGDSLTAR